MLRMSSACRQQVSGQYLSIGHSEAALSKITGRRKQHHQNLMQGIDKGINSTQKNIFVGSKRSFFRPLSGRKS